MNRKIVLVAAATCIALLGGFVVYDYAHTANTRAQAGAKSTAVVIAHKDIPAGTTWTQASTGGYLSTEELPASSVPAGAVHDAQNAFAGATVATLDITSGEVLQDTMFATSTAATGVLAIPRGLIAISVSLPANAEVAGFVGQGSEVAVFGTFPSSGTTHAAALGSSVQTTRLLLTKVPVLAISTPVITSLTGANSSSGSSGSVLLTLAVSQSDAEKLILSQSVGQLYLGLVSNSSSTRVDNGLTNVGGLSPATVAG